MLVEEYNRRLASSTPENQTELERRGLASALKRVNAQEDRITQAYVNDAMDLERYKREMDGLRVRRRELEAMGRDLERKEKQAQAESSNLEHLESFCARVADGLDRMTFSERQNLLRLLVERITVEDGNVRVDTIIPTGDDGGQLRNRRGELVEPPFEIGFN